MPKKGVGVWVSVTILLIVTIWIIEGFHIEGIYFGIKIELFVYNFPKICKGYKTKINFQIISYL